MEHVVDEWMDHSEYLSRWRGYDEKIRSIIEGCIRRYRYSGSFLNYVYRTLQYAARGIQPFYAYSLDETVAIDADKRKIENVVRDPETGEIGLYSRRSSYPSFQTTNGYIPCKFPPNKKSKQLLSKVTGTFNALFFAHDLKNCVLNTLDAPP